MSQNEDNNIVVPMVALEAIGNLCHYLNLNVFQMFSGADNDGRRSVILNDPELTCRHRNIVFLLDDKKVVITPGYDQREAFMIEGILRECTEEGFEFGYLSFDEDDEDDSNCDIH